MKKITSFSLDEDLLRRLAVVSENHKLSKSSIVEDYLRQILPILEAETPNKMMAKAMKKMAEEIDTTANLFDKDYEYTDKDFDEQWEELQNRKKD